MQPCCQSDHEESKFTLRHNERDGVSNHRVSIVCLTVCWGADQRKHVSELRVTGLCEGNPPVTGGFLSQRSGNAENVSIDDVIIVNGCVADRVSR